MKRNRKTWAAVALAGVVLIFTVPVARADFSIGVRLGDSFIVGGSDGIRARLNLGHAKHRHRRRHDHSADRKPLFGQPGQLHSRIGSHKQRRSNHGHGHGGRLYLLPARQRAVSEPSRPEEPSVRPPEAPKAVAPVVEKSPPNPAGDARLLLARGAKPAREITVGTRIPQDIPHVTLNVSRFDLPEPPPGQIYARIRGQVFLIDAATRLIHERIEP